jgi:endonuclease-3
MTLNTAGKNTAPSEAAPKLLNRREINELYRRLASCIDPKPELNFSNRFELLIAVVLSAQATDRSVNAVTAGLFQRCTSPRDYLDMGLEALEEATRSIGLYRNKSRAIIGICEALISRHDGQVPGTEEELTALPGVGIKTANVVLNLGFGKPVIAVDTHIFRVANRTGLVAEKTPEATGRTLMRITPQKYLLNAHHYLLLLGRYTCTARKPACQRCPLADGICKSTIKTDS